MTATEDETKAIRDDIAWAETGPWTEITAEVKARVAEREAAFDRWLKKVQADAWAEGERHESQYLATWGQFCPNPINPYREDDA